MTLRDSCLPIFESARVLLADVGLRRYDVTMRVVTWSGPRVGDGTRTAVDAPLAIQGRRPGVRQVSQKDIIASGGKYQDGDYRIGPFTPSFPGGGLEPVDFNPAADATAREVYYKIVGPGLESGAWFSKVEQKPDSAFAYYLTVRRSVTEGEP